MIWQVSAKSIKNRSLSAVSEGTGTGIQNRYERNIAQKTDIAVDQTVISVLVFIAFLSAYMHIRAYQCSVLQISLNTTA
jgi:hypothetical protein